MITARSHFVVSAVFAVLTGCGSSSDSPIGIPPAGGQRLGVAVVGGGSQQAFLGEALAAPIVVQVVDSLGRPVLGQRRVHFSLNGGAGMVSDTSALSAADGRASVTWRLGNAAGMQHLTAALVDVPASPGVVVLATAVPPSDADLIVVRGATPGQINVVMNQDDAVSSYRLVWPDTVMRLLPRQRVGNWEEVTAFSRGHPPATALQPWTDGVDTVRLFLRAPIAVPLTIWITYDFDTVATRARFNLDAMDVIWQANPTGLRLGTVRIENATALRGTIHQCPDGPGQFDPFDPAAINVYYLIDSFLKSSANAESCSARVILMGNLASPFRADLANLLAHEVMHSMELQHTTNPENVMTPTPGPSLGGLLTTGQIYTMHFDQRSAVNEVIGINQIGSRVCSVVTRLTHCLPQTFSSW